MGSTAPTTRKSACREIGAWPTVIADIIAEYAALTTEERVNKLVGEYRCGGIISCDPGIDMKWGYTQLDPRLIFVFPDSCAHFMMPKWVLAWSIADGYWRDDNIQRAFTPRERLLLNRWLATADP